MICEQCRDEIDEPKVEIISHSDFADPDPELEYYCSWECVLMTAAFMTGVPLVEPSPDAPDPLITDPLPAWLVLSRIERMSPPISSHRADA